MTVLIVSLLLVSGLLFAADRAIRNRPGLRKHRWLFGRRSYLYVIAVLGAVLVIVDVTSLLRGR
jgi:hypothetical protein